MSDDTIEFYIDSAQEEIGNYLNVKFVRQAFEETRNFSYSDWLSWGYIPTTFPVEKAIRLQGFLNTSLQADYPSVWLSTKSSSDKKRYYRQIRLVPIHGSDQALSEESIYVGITPYAGYYGLDEVPNYWSMQYITGFQSVPKDILNAIGKIASINIFHQLGDLIVGAGIASKSIGIDGLSQSISTTSSATNAGYGARIQGYLTDLKISLPILRNRYNKIEFIAA